VIGVAYAFGVQLDSTIAAVIVGLASTLAGY
jgi:hypothetical protein